MKFATAFALLRFAAAPSGVAGASPPSSVGPREGAAADAPEPRRLRRRALAKLGSSFVRPRSEVDAVEITVFNGCIEDSGVYTTTDVEVATCPGVGMNLATAAECRRAAASLGLGEVLDDVEWGDAPPGCICEPTNNNCRFNTATRVQATYRDDLFLLCKDDSCHRQVVTQEYTIPGTEDESGKARLSVDTSDWCLDAPYLTLTLSGVREYAFNLGPPHGSRQASAFALRFAHPTNTPVIMGSSAVCPLYRGIVAFEAAVAGYADCLKERKGYECTAELAAVPETSNALAGLADASLREIAQTRASFRNVCDENEIPQEQCNFALEHVLTPLDDAEAWVNEKKETLCIPESDEEENEGIERF